MEKTFLRPKELAQRWHCSAGHLANLRHLAKAPEYIKLNGGKVLYDLSVIEEYERRRVVKPLPIKKQGTGR